MAKLLGIDIGYDSVKLALVSGKQVKKTAIASMPKRLMRDGRLASPEAMGELLAQTMKKNGIHCSSAAVAFSNEAVFVRNVTMPVMGADQLSLNLPYEFRDYITEELKNYVFDYAMLSDAAAAAASAEKRTEKKEKKPKKDKKNALEAFESQAEASADSSDYGEGEGSGGATMDGRKMSSAEFMKHWIAAFALPLPTASGAQPGTTSTSSILPAKRFAAVRDGEAFPTTTGAWLVAATAFCRTLPTPRWMPST